MAQLIATKLAPPRLRPERVFRPHLYDELTERDGVVVLVSAPPGFGKSTVVAEWVEAQQRPFAWYSLDRFDSDVDLFGEYLAAAVAALTGHDSGLTTVPGEPIPDIRALVSTLIDDLADAPPRSVVVLDDYHAIEGGPVHEAVAYLIDTLPRHTTLALVTRADPPLPLARLRAQGRLVDIRGADLRFTREEVGEYLRRILGTTVSTDAIAAVAERSEGWIAALQLAAIGLDPGDDERIVAATSGEHQHIAGYLIDEVLDRLPADLAVFLLDTAPLDRFDAALCRRVTAADDPAATIDELERRNAFLIPLDGGWFRYHHLFAELLRSRLRRSDPDRESHVLVAAATACDERDLPDDAVAYALRSGDLALTGAILERHSRPQLAAGRVARLRSWLSGVPAPAGPAAGAVTLGWAWCRIFEGDSQAARELIDRVESDHLDDFATGVRGELDIMRAIVAFQAADPQGAERHARRGLASEPLPSRAVECLGHLYVGRSLYARSQWNDARVHLQRAAALADRTTGFWAVTASFWLGATNTDAGDIIAGEQSMLRARQVSSDTEIAAAAGIADTGLAFIRLNQLEPGDAIRLAERGTRNLERTTFTEMVHRAYFAWAEALSLAERFDESDAVATEGISWLHGRSMGGGLLEAWLWMSQSRNLMRQRRFDDAAAILGRVRRRGLGGSADVETSGFFEAAATLSLTLRRGDAEQSRRLLARLPPGSHGYVPFAIERHVLDAAVHEVCGEHREAADALRPALRLAADGYRYQFSHTGPVVRPILERLVGRTSHDGFVRSLLDRLPEPPDAPAAQPVETLTPREHDVLAEVAAGYTNNEIAARLYISRGTVKRHTANIYRKLGVHHRAEAAARARALGLIRRGS